MEKVLYFIMAICCIEYLAMGYNPAPRIATSQLREQQRIPFKERGEIADCVKTQIQAKLPAHVCRRVTIG
jgi:hypothetical protein